jgi:hypothetical protein
MKTYGAVEVYLHALTSTLDGGEWSASRPCRLTSGTYLIGGWVGPRAGLDACLRQESNPVRPASIVVTILTQLPRVGPVEFRGSSCADDRTVTGFGFSPLGPDISLCALDDWRWIPVRDRAVSLHHCWLRSQQLCGPPSFLYNGYRDKAAGPWSWPLTCV